MFLKYRDSPPEPMVPAASVPGGLNHGTRGLWAGKFDQLPRIGRDEFKTPPGCRVHPPRLRPRRTELHPSHFRLRKIRWSSVPRRRFFHRDCGGRRDRPLVQSATRHQIFDPFPNQPRTYALRTCSHPFRLVHRHVRVPSPCLSMKFADIVLAIMSRLLNTLAPPPQNRANVQSSHHSTPKATQSP